MIEGLVVGAFMGVCVAAIIQWGWKGAAGIAAFVAIGIALGF